MSRLIIFNLALVLIAQLCLAENALEIATKLDKLMNEPKSLQHLLDVMAVPYSLVTCDEVVDKDSELTKLVAENHYNHIQTEKGKTELTGRTLQNAKFTNDDKSKISFEVNYTDGENVGYGLKKTESGEWRYYEEYIVGCR